MSDNTEAKSRKTQEEMLKTPPPAPNAADDIWNESAKAHDTATATEDPTQNTTADATTEPEVEDIETTSAETEIQITKNTELEELQAQYQELDDKYKRLWADQQNMLKRFQREREDLRKSAARNTVEAILPAFDNFDFAKRSINADTKFEDVAKCFDMLKTQFLMSLNSIGLEEITDNEIFNPELHEAITAVPNPELPDGSIMEVVKPGYKLNGSVIRAANVVVSQKA